MSDQVCGCPECTLKAEVASLKAELAEAKSLVGELLIGVRHDSSDTGCLCRTCKARRFILGEPVRPPCGWRRAPTQTPGVPAQEGGEK